jgi:3-methyladenine DNA glycosylase AlkC
MAQQLKHFFSPALVQRLAADIRRVHPGFATKAFTRDATNGLGELELLARGRHIAQALATHLPDDYPAAIDILLRSLGPEHATDELVGAGMAPFFYLPHTIFVAERGLDHFEASMAAQYELTKRFSAEGSIRPYIAHYPERTIAMLRRWANDKNPHVRRLVSEGTRLRLPWAPRVAWLDANPDKVIALLDRLKDDPASLVRRSVANNLNDLGKVHPDLLAATASAWLDGATAERRAMIEHALRSAVKRGEPKALGLLGYGRPLQVVVEEARFDPPTVRIGGTVAIAFTVRSKARGTQEVLVDLGVHFVKAGGRTGRKVFKLQRISLEAGGSAAFRKVISLAVHTTRKPNAGVHRVDALINGRPTPIGSFAVTA